MNLDQHFNMQLHHQDKFSGAPSTDSRIERLCRNPQPERIGRIILDPITIDIYTRRS